MLVLKLNVKSYKLKWHFFFRERLKHCLVLWRKHLACYRRVLPRKRCHQLLTIVVNQGLKDASNCAQCFDDIRKCLKCTCLYFSGQRATVEMLADSILARRIANSVEQKEVIEWCFILTTVSL